MIAFRGARMYLQCDTCYACIARIPPEHEEQLHSAQAHAPALFVGVRGSKDGKTHFCSDECEKKYVKPPRAPKGAVRA